jgi:putative ABC transport system substrate-binding protein
VRKATTEIPIVFALVADPVGTGLVSSLARPGGNVTGLSTQHIDATGKRLEILREFIPNLKRLGIMANINNLASVIEMREAQRIASSVGLQVTLAEVRNAVDIAPAFGAFKDRADALFVVPEQLFNTSRVLINELAIKERLPTMHGFREPVEAGGLLSYGPDYIDMFRRTADFVDRVLRGAKPSEIPVEQPTKFELVVNLRTAKALSLTVPPMLLTRADEVIE